MRPQRQPFGMTPSLAFQLALIFLVAGASAAACDCGFGEIINPATCLCRCTAPYQLPNCLKQLDELAKVYVYVNEDTDAFSSETLTNTVRAGLVLGEREVIFFIRERNTTATQERPNELVVQLYIKSQYVQRLLDDVNAAPPPAWVTTAAITGGAVVPEVASDAFEPSNVKLYSFGNISIYLSDVSWLLAFIFLCFFLCCAECLCLNAESGSDDHDDKPIIVGSPGSTSLEKPPVSGASTPRKSAMSTPRKNNYIKSPKNGEDDGSGSQSSASEGTLTSYGTPQSATTPTVTPQEQPLPGEPLMPIPEHGAASTYASQGTATPGTTSPAPERATTLPPDPCEA